MHPIWDMYISNISQQNNVILSDHDIEQAGNVSQDLGNFYHRFTDKRRAHDKDKQPWEKNVKRPESVDF